MFQRHDVNQNKNNSETHDDNANKEKTEEENSAAKRIRLENKGQGINNGEKDEKDSLKVVEEILNIDEETQDDEENAKSKFTKKLIEEVTKAVKENSELSEETIDLISDKIADKAAFKTFQLIKEENEEKEAGIITENNNWADGSTMISCKPCIQFSDGEEIPKHLLKHKKGNFGIVEKSTGEGKQRKKYHIRAVMQEHENNPLHIHCLKFKREDEKQKHTLEEKTKRLGEL